LQCFSWAGCGSMDELLYMLFSKNPKLDDKVVIQACEIDNNPIVVAFKSIEFVLFYLWYNRKGTRFYVGVCNVLKAQEIFPHATTNFLYMTAVVSPLLYLGVLSLFKPQFVIYLKIMWDSLKEYGLDPNIFRDIHKINGTLSESGEGQTLLIKEFYMEHVYSIQTEFYEAQVS
jgi:hypothetical protein